LRSAALRAGLRRKENLFKSFTQRLPLSARETRLGDALGYLRDAPNGADHREALISFARKILPKQFIA
jgi:hypothetical protein